jgi:transcriptional regulator of acetoin/glycerol metabolism
LLLTLARTTAEQIRQALLADAGAAHLGLFQEYLRTCSRVSGVVFALDNDVVMLNDHARSVLEPDDQATLLAHATEALAPGHRGMVRVELSSGQTARMYCRSIGSADMSSGIVAHVKLDPGSSQHRRNRDGLRMSLPGLVGSSPAWLHVCQELERVFRSGDWLAVEGEAGAGKLALLRAVQLRRQPVGRFVLLEARDAGTDTDWSATVREAVREADTVVIRHVEALDGPRIRGLSSALQDARHSSRDRPLWAAVTLDTDTHSSDLLHLLQLFPSTVEVPPLRLHLEDLPPLVRLFLSRLGQGGHLVCTPEAMRLLMRMPWPGNAEQVYQLLREVVKHRRTGSIEPEDLPTEVHTVSRRVLSPLEAMERDAIIRCLSDAKGSKVEAARSLGMSRATIYRKIRDYGIVAPPG